MLPQAGKRKRLLEPDVHASMHSEATSNGIIKMNHKQRAEGRRGPHKTHVANKVKAHASSKGNEPPNADVGVGRLSPSRNSRRLASQLEQVSNNHILFL